MIMIELEALNWSFQLLFYIYDMISGMSRAGGWPPVLDYVFTYSGSRPSYMILNSP